MRLEAWLADSGLSKSAFAERIGCAPSKITALLNGSEWLGRDLARRIAEATGGAVTANDFLEPPGTGGEGAQTPGAPG